MTEYVLESGDWPLLDATELRNVWRHFDPTDTRVCVVEDQGEIVAHWVAVRKWHVEAIYTKTPHLFRRIWRLMGSVLMDLGVQEVWTGAADGDNLVRTMLERSGAVPLPMDHFVVRVQAPQRETPCLSSH